MMKDNLMTNIDVKALTKTIVSIAKRSTSLRTDVQSAGLDAVQLIGEQKNGETVFITRLAIAMSSSMNRSALVAWLADHSPLKLKPAKDGTKETFTFKGKEYVFGLDKGWQDLDFADIRKKMEAVQWWDAASVPTPGEVTLAKLIKKVEGIEKGVLKAHEEGRVKLEDAAAIAELIAKVSATLTA